MSAASPSPALPLQGYRVLEVAHLIAGPVCGMYLGDMGAEVIKVEEPGKGDASRSVYHVTANGEGPLYLTMNRNKRGIALDLSSREGRQVFYRLVERADVVIEAYRGGVAERLEIDYARLARVNPRLIYCSLSAFGPEGPWREKPGLDALVQAMSGLMAITGEPDGGPALCGAPVVDTIGSLLAAQGILTALLHREKTGEGQKVDVSLLDGALLAHAARLSVFHLTGEDLPRRGNAHPELVPYQAFRAQDGWVFVAVRTDKLWRSFCGAIGQPGLAADPRFATKADRLAQRTELVPILEAVVRGKTVREWMEILEAADVLCAPVNNYSDMVKDPQVLATGMIVEQEHPKAGRFKTIGIPVKLAKSPGRIRTPAPALGEHTEQVLREAGYGDAEIRSLRERGVI
ncbi:MAG: CoA transferase [Candidatus Rokubacteria bacterium]|nr:CoA transferase [Candidatus Rokubacteria bacterium]